MSSLWVSHAVVGAFIVVMLSVGLIAKRFVRDDDDFLRGGRRVPWWAAGLSIYMGAFSAFAFVSFGSVVFTDGGVGLLAGYGMVGAYIVTALIFAKRWHRAALTTPAEYLEIRFGPTTRQFVAWLTLLMNVASSALRLFAFAMMMHGLLDLPILPTIIVAGMLMAIVALSGGLWGIVLADSVQFVILIAGLVPLVIMSVLELGGLTEFGTLITGELFAMDRGSKSWGWLFTWWLLQIITGNFSFPVIQRLSSVPTEQDARKAMVMAAVLLIPTPLLAMIPVAICFELMPGTAPELAFATIAKTVLPAGLLGLMAGSMIAATVSELETAFNIDSGIVTRDIYHRNFAPNASPRRLLVFARIATLVSAAVAIGFASLLALTGTGIFDFSESIASRVVLALVIPFIMGLLIRRISERAFFVAIGGGFGLSMLLWALGYSAGDVRLPLIGASCLLLALGALLLPPRSEEQSRITSFFSRISSPNPAACGDRGMVDINSIDLVGATIAALGGITLLLPFIASTQGAARIIEFGTGGALLATALLLFRIRTSLSRRSMV